MATRREVQSGRVRKPIREIIGELKSWLPNYDHGPNDYPTLLFRILASLRGGDRLEDIGYETFNIGWHELDQLGRVLVAIEGTDDVEAIVNELMSDEEEVSEARRRPPRRWNQVRRGNASVTDGQETFWADFPRGTSARAVLDDYLSTADYSGATGAFTVEAEIGGHLARARVGPGGAVLREGVETPRHRLGGPPVRSAHAPPAHHRRPRTGPGRRR